MASDTTVFPNDFKKFYNLVPHGPRMIEFLEIIGACSGLPEREPGRGLIRIRPSEKSNAST